ncbi:hypothetical protein AB1285_27000 [Microbacterium sp. NRRL B-14842]|uniref:hypothetical protein n=1 Tax=Microbacterium sp. NRRL B-14842 TaxID=3162881 RepID=UPI003D2C0D5C
MTEQSENPFKGAEIIAVYTAEEAVADGLLLHFNPATALEAGYRLTVLLTPRRLRGRGCSGPARATGRARTPDSGTCSTSSAPPPARVAGDLVPRETYVLRVPNATRSGNPSTATTASRQRLRVSIEGYNLTGQACIIIALPGED